MSHHDPKEIAKALFLTDIPVQVIAERVGVNRRTITRWADEGNWRDLKAQVPTTEQRPNVVTLKPKSSESRAQSTQFTHPPINRRLPKGESIDELEAIEDAIARCSATLAGEIDPKAMGGIARALIELFEHRRKLQPQTAAEIAQMVLDLKLNRQEFMAELKAAWAKPA